MIERTLSKKLAASAQKFQVITLTGPRQSGKTTLVRATFPALPYLSLEEPDVRQIALTDPVWLFWVNLPYGAILDEVHHTPDLFLDLQRIVDENRTIQFILTGSSNFLLMERISQSLAGRTAILHLLPLSFEELLPGEASYERMIFKGRYPRNPPIGIWPPRDLGSGVPFRPMWSVTFALAPGIGDRACLHPLQRTGAGRVGQLLKNPLMPAWRVTPASAPTRPRPGSRCWKVRISSTACSPPIAISTSGWSSRPSSIFTIRVWPVRCSVSAVKARSTCTT